jgi:prepilin-type processing-associated H-X9-DG protein
MYIQDYDETFTPLFNCGGVMTLPSGATWRNYTPWTHLIAPYIKNDPLFTCSDQNQWGGVIYKGGGGIRQEGYAGYGLNYAYLANYGGTDPNVCGWDLWLARSLAAVNKPAQVVMTLDYQGVDWAEPTHTYVWEPLNVAVDAPDAYTSHRPAYNSGWGAYAGDLTQYFDYPGYGGADFRHTSNGYQPGVTPGGGANVTFVDGHSKFYKVGGLTAGTNYSPTQPGSQTAVINPNYYIWNPDY